MRKMPKAVALRQETIQLNSARQVRYLTFDIDREFGGLSWEDANLPIPNITVINPENGHAHLIYELANPIWLRHKDDERKGDAPPVRYLKAVRKAMQRALGADTHYAGILTKNPLHPHWRTAYGPVQPYTLGELSAHLELGEDTSAVLHDNPEGRNCTLFDSGRLWAYRAKNGYSGLSDFRYGVLDELERLNSNLRFPLNIGEVLGIAKSVSTWVWTKYTGNGRNVRRRGIMGLKGIESLTTRQQKGQQFTCEARKSRTLARLLAALQFLRVNSLTVTRKAVALQAGMHVNTVRLYWQRLLGAGDPVRVIEEREVEPLRGKMSEGVPAGPGTRYPDNHSVVGLTPHDIAERFVTMMNARKASGVPAEVPVFEVKETLKTPIAVIVDKIYERKRTTLGNLGRIPAD